MAQADNWAVFPTELGFTPWNAASLPNPGVVEVANSVYDDNDQLLFFVDGNFIRDAQGAYLGNIGLNAIGIVDSATGDTLTGYFANVASIGDCFRMVVTVGNACGETTDFTYFKIDGSYKMAGQGEHPSIPASQYATEETSKIQFAQLPQEEKVSWQYEQTRGGTVRIVVRDISGRVVLNEQYPHSADGSHASRLSTAALPEGIFIYQIDTPTQHKQGRFIVSR